MSDARTGGASAWNDAAAPPPPPDDGSLTLDCGCATGCTCGCMDWTDLEALGPILEAAPTHGAAAGHALDVAPLLPSLFARPPAPPPPPPAGALVAAGGAVVEGPPRPGSTQGGAASGAAGDAVMQQPPPATVPPPGATSGRTRCLNDTHAPNCARCIPPPPPDEDCELVGDVGKKARGGNLQRRAHSIRAPLLLHASFGVCCA